MWLTSNVTLVLLADALHLTRCQRSRSLPRSCVCQFRVRRNTVGAIAMCVLGQVAPVHYTPHRSAATSKLFSSLWTWAR